MPLTDPQLLSRLNDRPSPAGVLLGARLVELDSAAGTVRLSFDAKPAFCNPAGSVQGGFVAAMLDEAAGICAIAHAGRRVTVPTLEFKVSFIAAARPGPLFALAHVIRMGGRIAFVEADLHDPTGSLLARMSSTAMPAALPRDATTVRTEHDGRASKLVPA